MLLAASSTVSCSPNSPGAGKLYGVANVVTPAAAQAEAATRTPFGAWSGRFHAYQLAAASCSLSLSTTFSPGRRWFN